MKHILRMALVLFSLAVVILLMSGILSRSGESAESNSLTIKGSDTMVNLVSAWAEAFMKKNKGLDVSVTGGGSGTGIAALLNGTTDICAASRQMEPKEFTLAGQKGLKPKEITVGLDGIAVVVNPSNPVSTLTLEQLKKMYTGASTSWNQFGGPKENIIVLSRESSSGTYVFFQEHVLQKADYAANARLMPATSAIIQAVSTDKWSIGYVGLGYAVDAKNKVKIIQVKKDDSSPAVLPSEKTVKDKTYPIARALYLYVNDPMTALAKKFIDFTLSKEGQMIVGEIGYIQL